MGFQIVVWILHLTEVQQVTHILLLSPAPPPSPLPHSSLPSPLTQNWLIHQCMYLRLVMVPPT